MADTGANSTSVTPLMAQYNELKAQAGDALLFFRMGDFYELFGQDAVEASKLLGITLTSRDKNKPDPMPMAGVPHHSAQGYIQKLLKAGRKVAVGEQVVAGADAGAGAETDGESDSKKTKSSAKPIVKRELTRFFTPAVQFDQEGSDAAMIVTALPVEFKGSDKAPLWVIAALDPSTGETRVGGPLNENSLHAEIASGLPIKHFIRIGEKLPAALSQELKSRAGLLFEDLPSHWFSKEASETLLKNHFGLITLEGFLPETELVQALGILVAYVLKTQGTQKLDHLRLPLPLREKSNLAYGSRTAEHLDLPILFDFLNQTKTSMGARRLKRYLNEPLCDLLAIQARQEALKDFTGILKPQVGELQSLLSQIYDLERLCGRVSTHLASPRDTYAIGVSIEQFTKFSNQLEHSGSSLLKEKNAHLKQAASRLGALSERILKTQKSDAPLLSREGGIFEKGTDANLDRLIKISTEGSQWLLELETRERARTGIPSLKVRYNRVFGYYIEITSAHLKNVPEDYQRKQTMVGAERFFTTELKLFEEESLTASAKQKALELELFENLLIDIAKAVPDLMKAADVISDLDALLSLARLNQERGWNFPTLDESKDLDIKKGRHPLVDQSGSGKTGSFVPNDTDLSAPMKNLLLITGPNMGGKSTVMRQVALIVILGQMGAPVPAESARWGIVRSLFTRIGAHDAISRGQSTFMVEMTELAQILHGANERSLIILDEIGRGTSTYDGMSVAWSTLEWIAHQTKARTLFATHYHELTKLEGVLPGLKNGHMAVAERASTGSLRFLYELRQGPSSESFGIQVAQMAGLPKPLIDRAWQVLESLEKPETQSTDQLSLFSFTDTPTEDVGVNFDTDGISESRLAQPTPEHGLVTELRSLNPDQMTPLQALQTLSEMKAKLVQEL